MASTRGIVYITCAITMKDMFIVPAITTDIKIQTHRYITVN